MRHSPGDRTEHSTLEQLEAALTETVVDSIFLVSKLKEKGVGGSSQKVGKVMGVKGVMSLSEASYFFNIVEPELSFYTTVPRVPREIVQKVTL